ncbi:membrane protein insertase YidC [Limosilactobacillus caecicola]|uniref:membrane protein insertase YidC n=1 Tax=Limosilactobacillus caecicola TaxID=2941332 RepID=UPI00203FC28E|nr:membrane protein insertase YidC [Limosilactobacillus caecicola]
MKKLKRWTLAGGLASLLLLLSGCVRTTKSGKPYGMVYEYLAKPMQHLMEWLAAHLGNNYGWAIIVIVIIVRMILLPLMMNQMKKTTLMQEKMSMIQPQLREIQRRQKEAKTPEEQAATTQAMMALYRDNNISMTGGIGCLPLLIQLPVFAALYAAIRYSPDLYHATFMGIALGKPSIILAILSFVAYLFQGWLSMIGMPKNQQKQMRMMMLMSPVMIFFISMTSSAGLGLYFFIGGLFAILQTWLINAYRPRLKKQIAKEVKQQPVKKPVIDAQPINKSTSDSHQNAVEQLQNKQAKKPAANRNQRRNAGKQHHKNN